MADEVIIKPCKFPTGRSFFQISRCSFPSRLHCEGSTVDEATLLQRLSRDVECSRKHWRRMSHTQESNRTPLWRRFPLKHCWSGFPIRSFENLAALMAEKYSRQELCKQPRQAYNKKQLKVRYSAPKFPVKCKTSHRNFPVESIPLTNNWCNNGAVKISKFVSPHPTPRLRQTSTTRKFENFPLLKAKQAAKGFPYTSSLYQCTKSNKTQPLPGVAVTLEELAQPCLSFNKFPVGQRTQKPPELFSLSLTNAKFNYGTPRQLATTLKSINMWQSSHFKVKRCEEPHTTAKRKFPFLKVRNITKFFPLLKPTVEETKLSHSNANKCTFVIKNKFCCHTKFPTTTHHFSNLSIETFKSNFKITKEFVMPLVKKQRDPCKSEGFETFNGTVVTTSKLQQLEVPTITTNRFPISLKFYTHNAKFPIIACTDLVSCEGTMVESSNSDHKRHETCAHVNPKFFYANFENHINIFEENANSNNRREKHNKIACVNNVNKETPAQTMTQSGKFGRIAKTNLVPKRAQPDQQILEEKPQYKRNDNDVALLARTEEEFAKNNVSATVKQESLCRFESVHGAQNSRSTNLLCAEQNMNDVREQRDEQQDEQLQVGHTTMPNVKNGNLVDTNTLGTTSKSNIYVDEERVEEHIYAVLALKNIKNIIFNGDFGPQQKSAPPPTDTCSDVCDTSSQTDLTQDAVKSGIAYETCNASKYQPATTTESVAAVAATTPSSVSQLATRVIQHDTQQFVDETRLPTNSVNQRVATANTIFDVQEIQIQLEKQPNRVVDCVSAASTAMTLAKFEDQCDEENLSATSSSYLEDKPTYVGDSVDETMKYEMKSNKSAVTLPSTIAPMRHNLLQEAKSETSLASGSSSSRSSLLATTDLSKLANFGKSRPRREGSGDAVTRSVSNDVTDSVLPARTLLRRQRRLQGQCSEDKKEDPIERLNRLRARISSTLSEVKGVLQHYSVDEDGETNVTGAITPRAASVMGGLASKIVAPATSIKPIEVSDEKSESDGPINFRFVRRVRRRSIFSEDKNDGEETKVDAISPKEQNEEKTEASTLQSRDEVDHEAPKNEEKELAVSVLRANDFQAEVEGNKQTENRENKQESQRRIENVFSASDKKVVDISEENTSKVQINNAEDSNEISQVSTLKTTDLSKHVKMNNANVGEATKILKTKKADTSKEVKSTTKLLIPHQKSDERRASIAAPEASKIEPPIEGDTPQIGQIKRRPSDSEAVLKRRSFREQGMGQKTKHIQKTEKTEEISKSEILDTQVKISKTEVTVVRATSEVTSANALATVKEEKGSDELAIEAATKANINQMRTANATALATPTAQAKQNVALDVSKKPKKRLLLKTKEPTTAATARRASVAAAEISQIEPPVNSSAKPQRRPSDSETVVKRKATTFPAVDVIENSAAKVRTITKVKRPSVKSNVSGGSASDVANNSHKDAAELTPPPLAHTPDVSQTQSVIVNAISVANDIDDAHKQHQVNNTTITRSKLASNDATHISATKLDGQRDAMVTTLTSTLRAVEAKGSTVQTTSTTSGTVTAKQLAELVNESILVKPTSKTSETLIKTPKEKLTISQEKDVSECNATIIENSTSKVPIIEGTIKTSKLIPADVVQSNTVQQVGDTQTPSQPESSLHEVNKTDDLVAAIKAVSALAGKTTKSDNTVSSDISIHTSITATTTEPQPVTSQSTVMPELQVVAAPVKPVQVYAESETPKDAILEQSAAIASPKDGVTKKKIFIKKVRKNSIDKAYEKKKLSATASQEAQETAEEAVIPLETPANEIAQKSVELTTPVEETNNEEVPPKKTRKVKKKVIIRRQQRKLSISDAFFQAPTQLEKPIGEIETLEKAIAYVTDDEEEEKVTEPVKPLKTCIKQREYEVGDWVMYGERFRKTQIRWKKGRITERITSISYKIDIDGQEVSAHISYIKKYTGRRVNFGGKEYLEIDYEQIAEEERRARTYSIWNMV